MRCTYVLSRSTLHFALSLSEHTEVKGNEKVGETFRVETSGQTLRAKHVVWAAGEFQYPRLNGFMGSEHCQHTATISRYKDLEGDDFIVIGGRWMLFLWATLLGMHPNEADAATPGGKTLDADPTI